MKANSIVNRYIFKQMVPPFLINLGFFSFLLLMAQILEITHLVVNYRTGLISVLLMLLYSMPYFWVFVIPMSVMMAVLVTFMRMSNDNEILALKAGGISIFRLIPPVVLFCLLGALLTLFMSVHALPWGRSNLKNLVSQVATSSLDLGLKERHFNDSFDGVVMYVSKIDIKTKTLIDVFIEDQRTPDMISTVVAPRGKLFSDPEKKLFRLRLFDGIINQVSLKNRTANSLTFDTYDVDLDLKQGGAKSRKRRMDEKEMSLSQILEFFRNHKSRDQRYHEVLVEFHRKFSLPFSCLALGMLALPLGIQSRTTRRSLGLVMGLLCFLGYYLLLSAGKVYGESGDIHPAVGMWTPAIIMCGVGIFLLVRANNERPFQWEFIPDRIRKWFIKK